jgi:ABC-2 type transport system ATP-binding protein
LGWPVGYRGQGAALRPFFWFCYSISITSTIVEKEKMQTAVEIKELDVVLGKDFRALQGVNVRLPQGKIVGFIGPSGAGKTTLIRSIVGRQKLANGSITVFGAPAGSKQLRSKVSYMTQEVSVYGDLTVSENLEYFATMLGLGRASIKSEVERLLKIVNLEAQKKQMVEKLSGGQKQRVSLAIALIGKPRLMVLDEPTVGLDPVLREQLWSLFRQLSNEGTTLLVSSHVMDEAERCDELLLIRDGQLLAQGSPKQLCEQTGTNSIEQSFLKLIGAGK